jgi:hypothetical protein
MAPIQSRVTHGGGALRPERAVFETCSPTLIADTKTRMRRSSRLKSYTGQHIISPGRLKRTRAGTSSRPLKTLSVHALSDPTLIRVIPRPEICDAQPD